MPKCLTLSSQQRPPADQHAELVTVLIWAQQVPLVYATCLAFSHITYSSQPHRVGRYCSPILPLRKLRLRNVELKGACHPLPGLPLVSSRSGESDPRAPHHCSMRVPPTSRTGGCRLMSSLPHALRGIQEPKEHTDRKRRVWKLAVSSRGRGNNRGPGHLIHPLECKTQRNRFQFNMTRTF